MLKIKTIVVSGLMSTVLVFAAGAYADDVHGTRPEAEALVNKAIKEIEKKGKDKAFAEFDDPSNPDFHVKDMYVFVNDIKTGKSLAHINPRLIGHDMINMKDANGKPYVRERIAMAKAHGKGWQAYRYYDPKTHKMADKETFFVLHDDYIVACGIYKQ